MVTRIKRYQFSTDDYVCAAIMIYTDIIDLFITILKSSTRYSGYFGKSRRIYSRHNDL